jgi:hypothetical protein
MAKAYAARKAQLIPSAQRSFAKALPVPGFTGRQLCQGIRRSMRPCEGRHREVSPIPINGTYVALRRRGDRRAAAVVNGATSPS